MFTTCIILKVQHLQLNSLPTFRHTNARTSSIYSHIQRYRLVKSIMFNTVNSSHKNNTSTLAVLYIRPIEYRYNGHVQTYNSWLKLIHLLVRWIGQCIGPDIGSNESLSNVYSVAGNSWNRYKVCVFYKKVPL